MKSSLILSLHILLAVDILKFCSTNSTIGQKLEETNDRRRYRRRLTNVTHLLEPLLTKYDAPALGGLLLDVKGTLSFGAIGVRKRGTNVSVTLEDLWHMGSVTKVMTATLVARLVEAGNVSWNDTVGKIFSRLNLRHELNSINFIHLLSHHAGIPANADWHNLSLSAPTLVGQRVNCVLALNHTGFLAKSGTEFIYSNWGYTVAGAMLEEVMGQSYENLMQRLIFKPLGMQSAGFGATSRTDQLTQPWGHTSEGLAWQGDNPLIFSPAGTLHCSLRDLAKFVSDHLRGHRGLKALLKPEMYIRLHTAPFTNNYAMGWGHGSATWAKGPIIWHNGSNTLNFAIMVIDLKGGVAAISTCNQGNRRNATDEVLSVLAKIPGFKRKHLNKTSIFVKMLLDSITD